ncbi:MAG: PorP/SprF family type IX secretion system membrane protein [Bacteroidetes bacterium]|nr:PorP/SprF family type IX secretion system membrane protein [Bacteroidota bacterium]MCB9227851.1 PorP/SprF family type IX secretion system membrane protein [Chitinophagales bacterium]
MNIKKHILLGLFIALFLFVPQIKAQDVHYTQYDIQSLQQTPANTANFDGNYRFSALYRNQWSTIKVPYNTLGFSFDMLAYASKKFDSKLGVGLSTAFDQAGDGKYRSLYAQIPISYTLYLTIKEKSLFKIGGGIYIGLINKSFDISALSFDNQYNGEVFDASIPINENFGKLNYTNFDLGIGYNLGFRINNKVELGTSLGIHHLNPIRESYLNNSVNSILQKRYAITGYFTYFINKKWDLRLDYLYQKQNVLHEHLMGTTASYYFKNNDVVKKGIALGVFYRNKDAVSAVIQYKQNNFKAGISYDINTSPLQAATNNYGAVEIGLVYIIKNVEDVNIKNKRKCFVF